MEQSPLDRKLSNRPLRKSTLPIPTETLGFSLLDLHAIFTPEQLQARQDDLARLAEARTARPANWDTERI